jgi:hypothetical protein
MSRLRHHPSQSTWLGRSPKHSHRWQAICLFQVWVSCSKTLRCLSSWSCSPREPAISMYWPGMWLCDTLEAWVADAYAKNSWSQFSLHMWLCWLWISINCTFTDLVSQETSPQW